MRTRWIQNPKNLPVALAVSKQTITLTSELLDIKAGNGTSLGATILPQGPQGSDTMHDVSVPECICSGVPAELPPDGIGYGGGKLPS